MDPACDDANEGFHLALAIDVTLGEGIQFHHGYGERTAEFSFDVGEPDATEISLESVERYQQEVDVVVNFESALRSLDGERHRPTASGGERHRRTPPRTWGAGSVVSPLLRIEGVAQSVGQQLQRQRRGGERHARADRGPRLARQERPRVLQDVAPRRRGE